MHLSVIRRTAVVVLLSVLSACTARFTAPVEELGGGPRFLNDGRQHRVNGGETLYAIAWMYDLDVNALARANSLAQPYAVSPGTVLTVDPRLISGDVSGARVVGSPGNPPVGSAVVTAVTSVGGLQRAPLPSTSLPSNPLPNNPLPSAPAQPPSQPPLTMPTNPSSANESTTARIPADVAPPVAVVTTPTPLPAPAVPPSEPVRAPPVMNTRSNSEVVAWAWPHSGSIVARFSDASVDGKGLDLSGSAGDAVLAAADGEVVYAGGGLQRYGNLLILKHNDHFLSAYAHNRSLLVKEGDVVGQGQKIAELGSSGIDRNMLHFEIRQDGKPVDPLLFLPSR